MQKYKYWIDAGKYSLLQKATIVVTGIVNFMILARMFKPEEFGVWAILMVISSIIETLRHALVKNAYVLFINTVEPDDKPRVEFSAYLVNFLFSAFMCILLLMSAGYLQYILNANGLAQLLRVYCISLILLVPFTAFEFRRVALMDFKSIFFAYFVRYGSFLVMVCFYFFTGNELSLVYLTVLYAVSILLGVFFNLFRPSAGWPASSFGVVPVLKRYLSYSKYVLATNIFSMAFRNTDSFLISHYLSPRVLAFYNSSTRVVNIAEMPNQVMGDIMYPKATTIDHGKSAGQVRGIYQKSVASILTVIIPFVIIVELFPELIIRFLAGTQYLSAVPLLQVMVLYTLFLPFVNQFGNVMDASGKARINLAMMACISLINLVLAIAAIRYFGSYGPMLSINISYFMMFVFSQVVMHRIYQVSVRDIMVSVISLYGEYYRMSVNWVRNRALFGAKS